MKEFFEKAVATYEDVCKVASWHGINADAVEAAAMRFHAIMSNMGWPSTAQEMGNMIDQSRAHGSDDEALREAARQLRPK